MSHNFRWASAMLRVRIGQNVAFFSLSLRFLVHFPPPATAKSYPAYMLSRSCNYFTREIYQYVSSHRIMGFIKRKCLKCTSWLQLCLFKNCITNVLVVSGLLNLAQWFDPPPKSTPYFVSTLSKLTYFTSTPLVGKYAFSLAFP